MDSANEHHQNHRLQDQVEKGSASMEAPSSYGDESNHDWRSNNIALDAGNLNNFLIQDFGHHWNNSGRGNRLMDNVSEKLLFESLAFGHQVCSNAQNYGSFSNCVIPSRGRFCQIHPSVNISNQLNQPSTATSISSLMDLQALDLFSPTKLTGSLSQHSQDANFINGVPEAKRSISMLEPKGSSLTAKKSRLGSHHTSCTPLKVRKEKLGDRVAALQQLVAPFGKTDTASVLMEAIGYIRFLQNQVETLSAPNMKSPSNQKCEAMKGGSTTGPEDHYQPKPDLRSRGLCLVPLSCMSYIAGDNNDDDCTSFGGRIL